MIRYNAEGNPLVSVQKLLISNLSDTIESKNLTIDERNLTSTQWVEYHVGTKRKSYNSLPTSNITAEAVTVDGFALSQTDNAGVTTTTERSYTANGMIQTRTDGRGNTTTTVTDKAGRVLTVTDAMGNVTTTTYDSAHDLPATVTDAQGNTSCYKYDHRGRKVAEWGTGIQPVCFGYDDADRMVTLTTFRAGTETVSTDPSDRTDGDTTTWSHHNASGMETAKTYADNTSAVKTYDAYNRVLTETDARGKVKVHTYEQARGLLLGTSYNDSTSPRTYTYNHLSQLTQVTDAAGVRTLSYNSYGEQESDSLVADNVTHLITETRDDKGRSTGYTYAKNGSVQQTVTTGYGSDGRIASAGFLHGGAAKQFSYEYMAGTHLLEKLTMPNNMSLTQSYEIQRDLLTGMAYHRSTTLVANRQYSYDSLGRPTARNTSRQGSVKNDIFGYNYCSELTTATVNGNNYAYDYDNIGNRETATESDITTNYTANELNQYTAVGDFTPTFDADGNQTLMKTTTGIWAVVYDAENRPVSFTNTESNTIIECAYDHMGRRATKKVTVDGSITLHQRYLYRGYLQIACCDLTRSAHPCLWLITWDPTQPIATRPLAIQKDGTWFTYGWDLTKNICELYTNSGSIRTSYTYPPYGSVTESGNTWQPIQWSSEYNDTELGMVYYNYRHYNPQDGRWLGRDFVMDGYNSYLFMNNGLCNEYDFLGLISTKLNETSCEFRLTLHWKIKFIPSMGNHKWNESEKYLWLNNAKNLVSNYFNVSHNFKCYSNDDCCNICKNGIKVDVVINEKPTKFKLDFLVIVYKNKRIRSEASKSLGLVRFNQDDINEKTLRNKYKQITLLHETGHMLGLSHPGQSGKKKASPGSEIDYEIDAESLMGFGNKLRLNDFQKAFCNRISKSMKKRYNKAQGNSSCSNPYEHCQKWIAK